MNSRILDDPNFEANFNPFIERAIDQKEDFPDVVQWFDELLKPDLH